MADFVAEVFCPSECVRLIQDQASMRNVDSRIHSLRFDCCVFLFYSFSAVTFATKSARSSHSLADKCVSDERQNAALLYHQDRPAGRQPPRRRTGRTFHQSASQYVMS